MAVQNLEIAVDVDIADAVAALRELQNELEDLADKISEVDARGAEGIDIATSVDQLDSELAALEGEIQAFEAANSIDVATDVGDSDFGGAGGIGGGGDFMGVDTMNVLARNVRVASMGGGGGGFGGGGGGFNFPGGGGRDIDIEMGGRRTAGALMPGGGGDGGDGLLGSMFDLVDSLKSTISQMDDFNIRMSDIHNLLAGLIPILVVFIGAIPAAVTALVTLAGAALTAAAAFLAIGGFGALGFAMEGGELNMQKLQDALMEVRDDFLEAFGPLAERLQPLFEDALDGLEMFFQAVANQGDALVALTDEARAFGRFLIDFVPSALRTLAGLVEALAPVFGELGSYLQSNFNNIVREFLDITLESLPALIKLAQNIAGVLKFLARLGIGFAAVSAIVLDILGGLGALVNLLGISDAQLGVLLGTLFTFISALAVTNFLLNSFVATALASAFTAMMRFLTATALASTQMTLFGSVTLANAIGSLVSFVASLITSGAALLGFSVSAYTATAAAAAFLTVISLGALAGLAALALGVASSFMGVADSIDAATNSMKDFNRVSGKGDGFNPYGGAPDSGAGTTGSTTGVGGSSGGGGGTTINVESTGDKEQDNSNTQKVAWYQGRTTGSRA